MPFDRPKWNHSSILVPSLPQWKIFVFGGSTAYFEEGADRNFGDFTNKVQYLNINQDLKNIKWQNVELSSKAYLPKIRESAQMIYDQVNQRLMVHGGWNNDILNDFDQINISIITGPEYTI